MNAHGASPGPQSEEMAVLDLESRLTIAHRLACDCAPYFIARRAVLIPEVAKEATARGIDAVDLFAAYARGVHARHLLGLSLATEVAS